jgi:hypothetical protein
MQTTTIIRDIYARPISRGYYFLQSPGLGPYRVFIHTNSDGLWVVEDLTLPIGSTKRFRTLESVHPHSVLTRLNMDGEAMEPSSHGYDAPSKLDELGKIEQLVHAAKAELRREKAEKEAARLAAELAAQEEIDAEKRADRKARKQLTKEEQKAKRDARYAARKARR